MLHWYLADRAISCRQKRYEQKELCYWNSKEARNNFGVFLFQCATLSMMYQIVPWKRIAVDAFNEECEDLTKSINTWWLKRETFNVAENEPINNRIVTVWCIDCCVNMNMTRPLMLLTKGSPRHQTQISIFSTKKTLMLLCDKNMH